MPVPALRRRIRDITGAYKHYWLPTLASAVYGSYLEEHFPGDALAGFGGAVGVSNLKEGRVGTNLVWTPLKGFDIGAEFSYVHLNESRPALPPTPCSTPRACRVSRQTPINMRAACACSGRSEPRFSGLNAMDPVSPASNAGLFH